jgi:rod shape-determining protein MreB
MYGRTPAGITVERPLRDGRIRSFDLVSKMLRYFMRKVVGKRAAFRPRLLLALPGGMAPSERQTLVDVMVDAGVRSVVPVDENVAAAIGAGIRIDQPYGRMNIDIGGGRTNVSVFSFGHQIVWDILDIGGDKFDEAIIDYLRKKHNLLIGAKTAEELKINIGSARMRGVTLSMDACGRSLVSGLPRAVTVTSEELIEALDEPLRELISALHRIIERTPPELVGDIYQNGICMTGGGAMIYGLDMMMSKVLGIPVRIPESPIDAVARGLSTINTLIPVKGRAGRKNVSNLVADYYKNKNTY